MNRYQAYERALQQIASGPHGFASAIAGDALENRHDDDPRCGQISGAGTRCRKRTGHTGMCEFSASQAEEYMDDVRSKLPSKTGLHSGSLCDPDLFPAAPPAGR